MVNYLVIPKSENTFLLFKKNGNNIFSIKNKEKKERILKKLLKANYSEKFYLKDTNYFICSNDKIQMIFDDTKKVLGIADDIPTKRSAKTKETIKSFKTKRRVKLFAPAAALVGVVLVINLAAIPCSIQKTENEFDEVDEVIEVVTPNFSDEIIHEEDSYIHIVDNNINVETDNNIKEGSEENSTNIENNIYDYVGSGLNEYNLNAIENARSTEIGQSILKYAELFDIDESILFAICLTESAFDHEGTLNKYSTDGQGAFQIEYNVYNGVELSTVDKYGNSYNVLVNFETMSDPDLNVLMAVCIYKSNLTRYKGNMLFAIQTYNCGTGSLSLILSQKALEIYGEINSYNINLIYQECLTNEELTNEIINMNIEFLKNPKIYIDKLSDEALLANPISHNTFKNADYEYATPNYIEEVLSYTDGSFLNTKSNQI